MHVKRDLYRILCRHAGHCLIVFAILALGASCICEPDLGEIEVDPCEGCPGGCQEPSSLAIQYDLSQLKDVGVNKKVSVSGTRTDTDTCFAQGSVNTLTRELSGQGQGNENVPNLQHGNWTINVIVFESGGTSHPKQTVNGSLPGGGSKTLSIEADEAGILQASLN